MAIYKEIRQRDGVMTNYHRILFLTQTVNRQNSIAVISYTDSSVRTDEKSGVIDSPYIISITYEVDYDPKMTIEKAYEYLKTLPEFEGATDV